MDEIFVTGTTIENMPPIETEQAVSPESDIEDGVAMIGVVTDCLRLNVRVNPDIKAPIVCVIDCLTEVMIDEDESTSDFYKVYTEAGIEGFCMKKFITIR